MPPKGHFENEPLFSHREIELVYRHHYKAFHGHFYRPNLKANIKQILHRLAFFLQSWELSCEQSRFFNDGP